MFCDLSGKRGARAAADQPFPNTMTTMPDFGVASGQAKEMSTRSPTACTTAAADLS